MHPLFLPTMNFLILIALLVWKGRAPARLWVKDRHVQMRDNIATVAEKLRLAKIFHEDTLLKIKGLEVELAHMREHMRTDIQQMQQKGYLEAQREASAAILGAQRVATSFAVENRRQIIATVGAQVLDLAEARVRAQMHEEGRHGLAAKKFVESLGVRA